MLDRDQILFESGDRVDNIFLILRGVVTIEILINGNYHKLDILGRGSILGLDGILSLNNKWNYRAIVCSHKTANIVEISRKSIQFLASKCLVTKKQVLKSIQEIQESGMPQIDYLIFSK